LRNGERVISSLEVGRSQTLCINGAHESCPEVHDFPADVVKTVIKEDHTFLVVNDLEELLHRSADEDKLFSEMGVAWAKGSEPYQMGGYSRFPAKSNPPAP